MSKIWAASSVVVLFIACLANIYKKCNIDK